VNFVASTRCVVQSISRRNEPGEGTRLKLVANSWVATVVAATAQAIALAQGFSLDPQVLLDLVKGSAVDAPYLHVKGQAMIAGEFPPAFSMEARSGTPGSSRPRSGDRHRRHADGRGRAALPQGR